MPASPVPDHNDNVTYDILSEGNVIPDEYDVRLIEIDRSLNRIPMATIELLDGSPAEQTFAISESSHFLPGKKIEIKIGYHSEHESLFKGIVLSQALRIREGKHSVLEVRCSAEAIKMTVGRKHVFYEKKKDSEIMATLLGKAGIAKTITATSLEHPALVQYQSSDWDFLVSRAEANGLVVHVTDDKVEIKKPEVSQAPALVTTYGRNMIGVTIDMNAQQQYEGVTAQSWDDQTMKMLSTDAKAPSENAQGNVTGKKLAEVLGGIKADWRSPAALPKEELQSWADARLLRARLSRIQGQVSFQGSALAQPNSLIELAGLGDRFNGKAYVSGVRHVYQAKNWVTYATLGLTHSWLVEQHTDVDDPAASTLLPAIKGLHVGVVMQIDADPDGRHRIQVQVPALSEQEGIWARMAHLYATQNAGSFFLPEIGDEVLLGFLNQDPRHPVILGMLYNGKKTPPYTADDKNTFKAIVSRSEMKLEFEDEKKILTLQTPAGNTIVMDEDQKSILIEDQHGNKIEMSDSGIVIESIKDIQMKAQGNISLEAQQALNLKATQDLAGEGLNVAFKGNVGFKGEGSATAELKAGGQTTVKGAMVMIN